MGWFRRGGGSIRFKGRSPMEVQVRADAGNPGAFTLTVTSCQPNERIAIAIVDPAGRQLGQEAQMAADGDGELKISLPRPQMPGCVARARSVVRGEMATAMIR